MADSRGQQTHNSSRSASFVLPDQRTLFLPAFAGRLPSIALSCHSACVRPPPVAVRSGRWASNPNEGPDESPIRGCPSGFQATVSTTSALKPLASFSRLSTAALGSRPKPCAARRHARAARPLQRCPRPPCARTLLSSSPELGPASILPTDGRRPDPTAPPRATATPCISLDSLNLADLTLAATDRLD
jgi:hypothetical protein